MRIVHSWLTELAPLGDDIDSIASAMTSVGLVVEEIVHVGGSVEGVITARVIRTERHPDAAKVHRVFVDTGDGVERHVWCGAFNMVGGDIIPLATPGTTMPDGRVIEPKPILGISSDGMLCSPTELGIDGDASGILIMPSGAPLGVPYGDVLGLTADTVYDLDVTRNRPDCLGHVGVAREVAAKLGATAPVAPAVLVADGPLRQATVELVDGDRCARFTSLVIGGVVVGVSPEWIARRLTAAGMRPINNVVDASNYVMLELNQPNHAYDFDALGGGGFRVRCATNGETIVTLDGAERTLSADDLLICDANDVPIGIGGIMGGLDSEISDATTTIALEVAWFEPLSIAGTASRHGLRSEASIRFDRGVDHDGMPAAAARFVELLRLSCPGLAVHAGAVDARSNAYPSATSITLRPERLHRLLGVPAEAEQIISQLAPIGLAGVIEGAVVRVAVPSWRPDLVEEVDLIEEFARHYGFERIGATVPKSAMHGRLSPVQQRRRQLRQVLIGAGLSEAMPNPFLAPGDLERAGLVGPTLHLANPLVAEESVLRTSLRPGLLKSVAYNASHRNATVALFEIGHCYPPGDQLLPDEFEGLGVVLAGHDATAAMQLWREISSAMGLGARLDQAIVPAGLHPTRSATLQVGRDRVGAVGEVHPDVLDAFGIVGRVAVVELDLTNLLARDPKVAQAKPISRFPSSDLDMAFVVTDDIAAERLEKAIKQSAGNLLADVSLFDVYRGAGVAAGSRSLAYRLRLQALDRTLDDQDVTSVQVKVNAAASKLGATLRSI